MVRFDLGPLLQGQTRIAKFEIAYNSLIIGPRGLQCDPPSRSNEDSQKVLITSGIFSLYVFYYYFYKFAMFGDTLPARNKVNSISLVTLTKLVNC